jgi:predicted transcriptional regulator
MNVTLSLDDDLVKKVRKIAVERDTTLTGLIRQNLERIVQEDSAGGRKRRERQAAERSFERFQFRIGKRDWTRADLYVRS